MDWNKVKSIYEPEETKYDWETLKTKFEPEAVTPPVEVPTIPQETTLKSYTLPKENLWDKIKKVFEAKPETQIAKAQVSYNISQKTGIPIVEVNQNLDKITKQLGIRGIPTTEEYLSAMFVFPVTAALIANPITAGIGVVKFMAFTEAENFVISKVKKSGYKFGAGKGLKELLPEESNQLTKDAVDIVDFLAKGYLIAKTDKNIMKMWDKFTKDITTEYGLPEKMYLSADKLRTLHSGKETFNAEEYTQFEQDIYKTLGNKADLIRKAFKEGGVDIEIPAKEMTTFADRPWFAKFKEIFGIKPFSDTVINYAGEVKPVIGLLEGKIGMPEVSKVIPKVEVETPITPTIIPKVETAIPPVTDKTEMPPIPEVKKETIIPKPITIEIPKITKDERILLEGAIEGDKGKFIVSWANLGKTAREKAITKLEEREYINKEGGLLTEEGIKLANTLKTRTEEEKKGISIEKREIIKPITDKKFIEGIPNKELITGKIGEEDYYSDSNIMLKGKLENVPIAEGKPDFNRIVDQIPKDKEIKIKPVIFSYEKDQHRLVWFDNKVSIQEKYYDYILNKFPNAEFRSVENRDPAGIPIKIYEKGEFVGLVMPLKYNIEEIPENVMKLGIKTDVRIEEGQALSARKWQVNMEKEAVIPEKINKTEIMTWTEKAFNVPLKGKVTHRWKSAGVYYPHQQIVRMEKWGELSVLTHEVAHDIDAKLKKSLGVNWRFINKEITKELADLDYDQSKNGRRTSEGFAEYMRHRMTTGQVEQLAPKFDKFFNEEILSKNPVLKANLEGLKKRMDVWNQQGAENRIIEHIDWKGEHTEIKGAIPKINKAIKIINENWNDEFYVPQKITKDIEKIIGRELPPSKNPAKMMEYSKNTSGIVANTFVMNKAIDENTNVIGPGLSEILKAIPDNEMKQFISYAVSKRALDLAGRNIESGFDIDDVKFINDKYKNKGWDKTVKELTDWSNHLLDWVVRAGGLDKETAQLMRDLNPSYLPFKRAFIDEISVTKGVGGYVDTGKGIKAIKGSGRPIINPLESMISQARELIAKSQKIRIAKLFINLAEEEGVGGFVTRVPAPMKATTFHASQIKDYLNTVVETKAREINVDDFLTVFTQDFKYNGKENIVTVWKNGKQEFYEIHPDLYEAFKGIDPLKLGPMLKVLSPFARILRLGATGLKVSFGIARNPFRDANTYVVSSKRNNATIFDPIKGYYKVITAKPSDLTWRYLKGGGTLSGQVGFDRASVQNSYDEMLSNRLGLKGKVLKVVKHPINALSDILSVTEMGPRSAEMEGMYKQYTSEKWKKSHPDWTEEDAYIQAVLDAKDVTLNFGKSGRTAKQINQVAAFFNAAIRGPEKVYRNFRDRPIQTMVKGLLWLTLPTIALWYKNKDKEWYKNLPPAYKYGNVFYEIDGNVYRLPIPFELGIIFMAVPQAALDTAYTSQNKKEIWAEGIFNLVKTQIPDPTPSALGPLIDVARNKNYLGIPIESEGMQFLYPTERKRDYTTKLAVGLSKGMNEIGIQLSPIQIDYLIDSYSGGFGKQFKITGEELADYPVIGDLILRDPYYPKRQLNNFFSDWEYLKQKEQTRIATKEEKRKLNKIDGFYNTYKLFQKLIKKAKEKGNKELLIKYENQLRIKLELYGYK